MLLGKSRTVEVMADVTLSIAAEINSALQTIIGHCDLLERGYPDPALQRDLAMVIRPGTADRGAAREDAHRRERPLEGSRR